MHNPNSNIYYITGNQSKFLTAQHCLQKFDISIQQKSVEVPEIQAESSLDVALDKATKAFALVKKPLLVSDHGWAVEALNGFPGPYMKYINTWLTPQDILALMAAQQNRRITLQQYLVYTDGQTTQTFEHHVPGQLLNAPRGEMGSGWDKIASITSDGKTIAETRDAIGSQAILLSDPEPWQSFARWYSKQQN